MMNKIPIFFATWFGVGYLPKIPGTWASAAALPPAYLIVLWGGAYWLAISSGIIFVIGVWVSSRTASILEKSDPSEVVIDEIVGQWITLLFVPFSIYVYLAGFFLFRLFPFLEMSFTESRFTDRPSAAASAKSRAVPEGESTLSR